MNTVSLFHYLLTLIIWCNQSLFLIILNSLFTDSSVTLGQWDIFLQLIIFIFSKHAVSKKMIYCYLCSKHSFREFIAAIFPNLSKTSDIWIYMYNFKEVVKVESEAVTRRCSLKQVFLEIYQNSQENTCSRVSFLTKLALSLQLY